ncbi:MAG: flagellar protein FlaG [Bacillota bacterium]
MKLPEIDPIIMNRIRSQTAQKQIQESRQTKVAGEKKERDRQDRKKQDRGRSLEECLKILNQAMEDAVLPIRFQLVQRDGAAMVQMLDIDQKQVIREVLPEKVRGMASRVRDMLGMVMDELI